VTFVAKTNKPDAEVHVVDDRTFDRARCGEDLKDYLEVPQSKVEVSSLCPKCLEKLA
jgi:hypothetical protein